MVHLFLNLLISLLFGLIAMALFTLLERRILALSQLRKGPNKPSLQGLLLPLLDAMKLLLKQPLAPAPRTKSTFFLAPFFSLLCASILWLILPLFSGSFSIKNSLILFLAIASLHTYTIFMMSWSSNSKFSSIGMSRSLAQMLSYEIAMALVLILLVLPSKTLTLDTLMNNGVVMTLAIPMVAIMWLISCVAETSRAPFDSTEGESELVSGFNTEYSSAKFALIFMAEYLSIITMSTLTTILLTLPSNLPPLTLISPILVCATATLFIFLRATLPRTRYDTLMWAAWGLILPLTLTSTLFTLPLLI